MPTDDTAPRPDLPPDAGIEAIQSDIEQTRKELGDTVNALSAKADVTGRVKAKVSDTRTGIAEQARSVPAWALLAGAGVTVLCVVWWRRR